MKKLLFILLFTCFACNQPKEYPKLGTKNILKLTSLNKIIKTPVGIKQKYGINIYSTHFEYKNEMTYSYDVRVYCENADFGGFIYGDVILYDKVYYCWENDSLLKFRLFNSINNRSKSFTYSCFKENHTMGIDSINGVPINSVKY
jgi:hypothetical protein